MPPSFQIDRIAINPPVLLAPMEDVTSLPFRLVCKRIANPGLMFTEFVSAMAIHYQARKGLLKMRVDDSERPLGIQIFGGEPETMAEAAKVAVDMGADLVDINMGCWVPKVCRTGSGAALLKDPEVATQIVRSVVKAVDIPVTVKVRAGWDYSLFAAPELAKRFEGEGIKMLTLHARFAKQGFEGKANWDLIKELRDSLTIPLIGNGDITTASDAKAMMHETGCDGVMVGRAAISNPWSLAEICDGFREEKLHKPPTVQERIDVAIEVAQRMVAHTAELADYEEVLRLPTEIRADVELRGVRALRGQLPLYIKGSPGAPSIRNQLSRVSSVTELTSILESYRDSLHAGTYTQPEPEKLHR